MAGLFSFLSCAGTHDADVAEKEAFGIQKRQVRIQIVWFEKSYIYICVSSNCTKSVEIFKLAFISCDIFFYLSSQTLHDSRRITTKYMLNQMLKAM